jgi:peptide/nickel transport system permease protein
MDRTGSERSLSGVRVALRQLKRHRLAWVGGLILAVLYTVVIFADFLAPYSWEEQNRRKAYHPPTRLHVFDEEGRFTWRPYIYHYRLVDPTFKRYEADTSRRFPLEFFVQGAEHRLLGVFPTTYHLFGVPEPARIFLLGSDHLGRDVLTRLLYGGRVSLSIGFVGVAISFVLGMLVGGIAGHYGGAVDNVLMRLCELIQSFPGFYLMLSLRAVFPPSLSSTMVYLMIVVIFSFIGWAGLARIIRGMVLSLREQPFVESARAIGAGSLRIILRHTLPNTLSYVIVAATLSIPSYILGESALSLLGLGIQEPQASWGNMLSAARNIRVLSAFPWVLTPGVLIFITVMAFNFLGDGLRDALDPKMKV